MNEANLARRTYPDQAALRGHGGAATVKSPTEVGLKLAPWRKKWSSGILETDVWR